MRTCIEYTMNFNMDPELSFGLSVTPHGPEHHYIGDDGKELQDAGGPQ